MDVLCLFYFVFTTKIEFSECCVWFQCLTQWCYSSFSNLVPCWYEKKRRRVNRWWMSLGCLFPLYSPFIMSLVSVVFDFSDSLNDVAPVSPTSMSVYAKRNGKECIVDGCLLCVFFLVFTFQIEFSECCVWLQWFTQWCCSCVSNIITCIITRNGRRELLMDVFCVSFFCFQNSDRVL